MNLTELPPRKLAARLDVARILLAVCKGQARGNNTARNAAFADYADDFTQTVKELEAAQRALSSDRAEASQPEATAVGRVN